MVRFVFVLAPLALLAGCKHAEAPALKFVSLPSVAGTGWTAASDAETGVSLALPPGWRVGLPRAFDPPTNQDQTGEAGAGTNSNESAAMNNVLSQMSAQMAQQDAEHEKEMLARMREKENIVLHCVDGSKPTIGEEPTRLYVKRLKDVHYSNLDEAAVAEKQDTHREAKTETVDLPVGKAIRLVAQGQNRIGDQECHVSYVLPDGPDAWVLRFASTNNPQAILNIERSVAQSFRVKRR